MLVGTTIMVTKERVESRKREIKAKENVRVSNPKGGNKMFYTRGNLVNKTKIEVILKTRHAGHKQVKWVLPKINGLLPKPIYTLLKGKGLMG